MKSTFKKPVAFQCFFSCSSPKVEQPAGAQECYYRSGEACRFRANLWGERARSLQRICEGSASKIRPLSDLFLARFVRQLECQGPPCWCRIFDESTLLTTFFLRTYSQWNTQISLDLLNLMNYNHDTFTVVTPRKLKTSPQRKVLIHALSSLGKDYSQIRRVEPFSLSVAMAEI